MIDCLDRVMDKGVVVDEWVPVSLVGIDLRIHAITVDPPPDRSGSDPAPASGAGRNLETIARRSRKWVTAGLHRAIFRARWPTAGQQRGRHKTVETGRSIASS